MKSYKTSFKGISIISLIITIVVVMILLAVMVPIGEEKAKEAQIATFNDNIISVIGEVQSYMVMNNQELPVQKDASGNYIVYSLRTSSALLVEATKWNDQNDTFYIIDMKKLKLDNLDSGMGKTIDDYYVIASKSKNIYYIKGLQIDDKTYYTKTDTPIKLNSVAQ